MNLGRVGRQCCILSALAAIGVQAASLSSEEVFQKLSPSVFVVHVYDKQGREFSKGSGVVIGPGRIVTNCHVLAKGSSIAVSRGNSAHGATLELPDPEHDLCQLKVKELTAPAVPFGSTATLKVGGRVYAIGAPLGLELTLTDGVISSLRGDEGKPPQIQTTAAMSPGSSGGGLFDAEGKLIGIATWGLVGGQQLNFAVPVEWVAELPQRGKAALARWQARPSSPAARPPSPASTEAKPQLVAASAGPGESYPHTLSREEILTHFARYVQVDARVGKRPPFTLKVGADGRVERACGGCRVTSGRGTMTLKADQGMVCFKWDVTYPESGCFQVVQTSSDQFEMRGSSGEPTIRYSVAL